MRYYLDTEFNGFGGELISLALVREDGNWLYLIYETTQPIDPWVAENVMPILHLPGLLPIHVNQEAGAEFIAHFLAGDDAVEIITDWPDDIRYFCQSIISGPGMMSRLVPSLKFSMIRADAYPTTLPGAVQHNAVWDARALRHLMLS
ncbi:hypothetical protein CcrSwift_gp063 [Caulobacter phage CcrSwift]|uniref:Uncharacterized protein n=1 Tax=Caulobacter phage CcrSwift TaxID=2927984 RepID=K4JTF7_9CAUD|nr:Rnase H [Caulobacter phage CcrSwift]AFU88381.1 hypothetical protein CcrSwift_gp063 [Caulobacter phage CcrSwift]